MEPPYKWIGDLQLYAVSDAQDRRAAGAVLSGHVSARRQIQPFRAVRHHRGKLLPDGTYQRPVCALICNFPPPQPDKPSLLSHDEVETIFHEFGHAMHTILTRAKYSRFSGTSVPQDFVEAPSQMLENWPWDKKVLDSFAADYRDPSKKSRRRSWPAQGVAARHEGTFYRRQLSFGLMDLALHTQIHATNADEVLPLSNQVFSDVSLPVRRTRRSWPTSATSSATARAITATRGRMPLRRTWRRCLKIRRTDILTEGRDEIAQRKFMKVGDSRDINISIEDFLGRPRSHRTVPEKNRRGEKRSRFQMSSPATSAAGRWPRQIKFIVGNEACERFSYYGMPSILAGYITGAGRRAAGSARTTDASTEIIHLFMFANYFMPLFGAWLSDKLIGRYHTILWVSLFYCAGHGVLACSDLAGTVHGKLACLYAGMALIAFGSGGIKPCVSAFMGDQFKPEQSHLLQKAYGAFYWAINLGSFFSFLVIPWIKDQHGYSLAFGVPGIFMAIATFIFWLGTKHYVRVPPSRETKSAGFFKVFFCRAVGQTRGWTRFLGRRTGPVQRQRS